MLCRSVFVRVIFFQTARTLQRTPNFAVRGFWAKYRLCVPMCACVCVCVWACLVMFVYVPHIAVCSRVGFACLHHLLSILCYPRCCHCRRKVAPILDPMSTAESCLGCQKDCEGFERNCMPCLIVLIDNSS